MGGAEAEAAALDAYYRDIGDAKELIRYKMEIEGMKKWERALDDVAQYISLGDLNELKKEFYDFVLPEGSGEGLNDDTDSMSIEEEEEVEGNSTGRGNFSPEVDDPAMIDDYQAEYRKLAKSHTMWPGMNTRRMLSRSSTTPNMEERGTALVSPTRFRNGNKRFYTPRGGTEIDAGPSEGIDVIEPMMNNDNMIAPRPTTSPVIEDSSFSGLRKDESQIMRSSAHPRPLTAPAGLMNSTPNDDWFGNLRSIVHNFVYGKARGIQPNQPVKVAILDSGYALTGNAHKAMRPYLTRIKDKKTFTKEFPDAISPKDKQIALDDLVGHGTTVAYQLMETCPSAHVYIAKVTVTESADKKAVPDKGAVARAIRHAATPIEGGGWGVDIINMSFGWNEAELPGITVTPDGISGAIEFAKEKRVLLFAAASNYGLAQLNDVFYPARDSRVISVDAEDGLGNPASFARNSIRWGGGTRYCAPGLSVESPVSATAMCGSSFACPVAAGVAALVLEFARQETVSLSKSSSVQRALSSSQGMLRVFEAMSQQAANHPGFKMLYPWHFLGRGEREEIAINIIRQLEIEFGEGNVGIEVIRTMSWRVAETV
ncbi:peptidase S8/S53 domain-containing protein [Nemania diffusa]|nr:peptidase S8/S53 domain-containing protein [Nemania diffusa]